MLWTQKALPPWKNQETYGLVCRNKKIPSIAPPSSMVRASWGRNGQIAPWRKWLAPTVPTMLDSVVLPTGITFDWGVELIIQENGRGHMVGEGLHSNHRGPGWIDNWLRTEGNGQMKKMVFYCCSSLVLPQNVVVFSMLFNSNILCILFFPSAPNTGAS